MMNEGKVFVLMVVVAPSSYIPIWRYENEPFLLFLSRLFLCDVGFVPIHPTHCNKKNCNPPTKKIATHPQKNCNPPTKKFNLSTKKIATHLNLGHGDLVILCVHLLVVAEDVSQLVVVFVLILVEDLKVDSLRAQI